MLHEAGYTYSGDPAISSLTFPEIRRLLEGRRVDTEIRNELKEASRETSGGGRLDDALGKTVPRESDKAMLQDMDAKIKQQKAN